VLQKDVKTSNLRLSVIILQLYSTGIPYLLICLDHAANAPWSSSKK
jgi:hypothetical protein